MVARSGRKDSKLCKFRNDILLLSLVAIVKEIALIKQYCELLSYPQALTWTFFQQIKKFRNMISHRQAKNYENTIMGCMASAATVCIMMPMDTIKTRLVTQSSAAVMNSVPYKGIVDCAVRIAKEEGIKTFYSGLTPRLVSVVPMIGIQFGVYEAMKNLMLHRNTEFSATTTLKR